MKASLPNILLTVSALFTTALTMPGCQRAAATSSEHDHADEPSPAVVFKAGHGLQLSAAAASFIRLACVDVATRDFPREPGATAIPASSIVRTARGDFVYVANGEWYLRTPVETSVAADGWVAVTEGLYEGDTVVATGARALWLAEIQAVNGGVSCTDGH